MRTFVHINLYFLNINIIFTTQEQSLAVGFVSWGQNVPQNLCISLTCGADPTCCPLSFSFSLSLPELNLSFKPSPTIPLHCSRAEGNALVFVYLAMGVYVTKCVYIQLCVPQSLSPLLRLYLKGLTAWQYRGITSLWKTSKGHSHTDQGHCWLHI